MIFVFIEDGTLDVIDELSDDLLAYEGIDVENGIYTFFDEHGKFLKPIFHTPNEKGKELLGLFSVVKSGQYNLVSTPEECDTNFHIMLERVVSLNENKWFSSLNEIKNRF